MAILKDVVFVYVALQSPKKGYQTDDLEYSVSGVLSKEAAKLWNKSFNKQKARETDTSDFESVYKIAPPYPDQDEQYVITLKVKTHYKDGNKVPEEKLPKVFEKLSNGKLKDIRKIKLIANGSEGVIEYGEADNDYGHFAQLKNVRIDKLIEYFAAGGTELGDVVGDDDDSSLGQEDLSNDEQEAPKSAPKAKAAPKTPTKKVEEEVSEDGDDTALPW